MADDSSDYGLADDFDDLDDLGADDDDETGAAVLICTVETYGARFTFFDTVDDAARAGLRWPCPTRGCIGDHRVGHRDERGELRVVQAANAANTESWQQLAQYVDDLRRARAREDQAVSRARNRQLIDELNRGDHDDG